MALIRKDGSLYVRYTVPTPQRIPLGMSVPTGDKDANDRPIMSKGRSPQVWRTTGTGDKAKAKLAQPRIVAEIIDEIQAEIAAAEAGAAAALPDALKVSPREFAKGLLADIAAGDIDDEQASDIMSTYLDARLEASPSDPRGPLRSAMRMVTSGGTSKQLDDAIEDYSKARAGNINPKTLQRIETILTAFTEWHGQDDVASVTRRRAGSFVAEVIVPADTTYKTKVWHVSALRSAWRYFISREWTGDDDRNPWDGHLTNYRGSSRGTSQTTVRRNWTDIELKKLRTMDPSDLLYQVGVICLHHGTRVEEIASLQVRDVDLDAQTFTFREAKNQSSIRTLPIHAACLPLFTALMGTEREPGEQLFVSLKPGGPDKTFSHNLSKRAGRWLRKHVTTDPALVYFHSMRHTFTTALEQAGIDPLLIKRIEGHKFQDDTFGRYSKGADLERVRGAINAVNFGF